MPFYEYYSEETGEEQEVFHGINEEPEILDSEGNPMKRKISQIGNFFMGKDNKNTTRRTSVYQKRGQKPGWSGRTPSEAAAARAKAVDEGRKDDTQRSSDPYYKWRNT